MDGIERKFAQKLAGNEKEGRDKALKKLIKWLQLRSSPEDSDKAFTEEELLKLWKGLFFSMWMSDKPLVQEELAEQLGQLVHVFPRSADSLTFVHTFFTTMAREWNKIDNIRRDKFMMLVRRVLRQSLRLAADAGWSASAVDRLVGVYRAAFARPEQPATLPLGLQMHCVDIFLEEVAKVSRGEIAADRLAQLITPFVEVLQVSRDARLVSSVTAGVFYHLMRQTDLGISYDAVVSGDAPPDGADDAQSSEDDEPGGGGSSSSADGPLDPRAGGVHVQLPQLPVDAGQLAEQLTDAGSCSSCRQVNRRRLYRLATQFRDLSEGVYPLAARLPEQAASDSELSDDELQSAVLRLQTSQRVPAAERSRGRKKRKRAQMDEGDADADTVDAEQAAKKPKKAKGRVMSAPNGVVDAADAGTGDVDSAEVADSSSHVMKENGERTGAGKQTLTPKQRKKQAQENEHIKEKSVKKKRKKEARREKLGGGGGVDSAVAEATVVVNGHADGDAPVENGVAVPKSDTKKKKTTTIEASSEGSSSAVPARKGENSKRQNAVVGAPATPLSSKKQKKKNVLSPAHTDASVESSSSSTPPHSKKKKKKPHVEEVQTNGALILDSQAAESGDTTIAADTAATPAGKSKKKKKRAAAVAAAAAETSPADGGGDGAAAASLPWSVPSSEDWGDPPSPQRAARGAAGSAVARFVPAARPTATFVKTRRPAVAAAAATAAQQTKKDISPRTPQPKKLKICLNKNKEQTFREHLITVRNSPGVPHNPHMKPVKGLLKTPVGGSPARRGAGRLRTSPATAAPPSPGATPPQRKLHRRSHAADFFSRE